MPRLGNNVDGESVNVARRVYTLGEFLPSFLLGRRQRVVTRAAHAIARGRRLTGEPVLREFGRESVHDLFVVMSVVPLTSKQFVCQKRVARLLQCFEDTF